MESKARFFFVAHLVKRFLHQGDICEVFLRKYPGC